MKKNNNGDGSSPSPKSNPNPQDIPPSNPNATHSKFILDQSNPWVNNGNPIWLASKITFIRNVEKFQFPHKLPIERKKHLLELVSNAVLNQATGLKTPRLIKGDEIGSLEKEFLFEHFLSTTSYNQSQETEGFILDESGEFIATLNLGDHIHLSLLNCNGELEKAWSRLMKVETALGKTINYSFSPKFGFLTADPTQCGTAMVVSLYLQLSGLIHLGTIDDVIQNLIDDSLSITGIQGSPSEIIGDVLVVQNRYTLGVTEENIIASMHSFVSKVLIEEQSARATLKNKQDDTFKDQVSRAFGILTHSYKLDAVEVLNALSLLKLGLECGFITGSDCAKINELFFNCRRAHLLGHFKQQKINQDEIAHLRSDYIHHAFDPLKLTL